MSDRLTELVRALAAEIADQVVPQIRSAIPYTAPEPVVEPLTLTYRQVGERLNVSESTVRKLWTSGELLSVLIGGLRFTRAADLEAYVAALEPSLPTSERGRLAVVRDAA